MSLFPREPEDKFCFTYCGDGRCTCRARETILEGMRRQREEDARRSREITDRGGIDGTVRPSDRIGP